MLRNSLKIAIRSLWRQKSSSIINVIGLSIGLASSVIIFMFLYNETHYDSFNQHGQNIYRVYQHVIDGDQIILAASTPVPMGPALRTDFPEVNNVVRLYEAKDMLVTAEQTYFRVKNALYTDSSFFSVFSLDLLRGDKYHVLSEPRSVVLTESLARKMFGGKDPLNEMIRFDNDTNYFRISGICRDVPDNCHFSCEMLISIDAFWAVNSTDWMSNYVNTYILLPDKFPVQDIESKFPGVIQKYIGPQIQQVFGVSLEEMDASGPKLEFRLQPLKDIHLNSSMLQGLKPAANKKYLYAFSIIGVFIIFIAVINFINIATSRSTLRMRETGIRIIHGSTQRRLIWQFLSESILLSAFSMIIAIVLLLIILPLINQLLGLNLSFSIINPWILAPVFLLFTVLIGVLAGIYPAFLQSSVKGASALKDKMKSGYKGSMIRSLLVTFQFFIAIVILSGTIIVFRQLRYMQNKELGFDKEGIIVLRQANALKNQLSIFVEEIKKYPGIISATHSSDIPGYPNSDNGFSVEGRSQSENHVLYTNWVDNSYFKTFGMKLTEGRDFSKDFITDSSAIIINEATVRKLGLVDPVGTRLRRPLGNGEFTYYTIIGIVKDFHFKSLHNVIEPYAIMNISKNAEWAQFLSIRYDRINTLQSLQAIEHTWQKFMGGRPLDYSFLNDEISRLYKEEAQTGKLSVTFTLLSVFIACLGLFGLVSFTTLQRRKEISIRKILGASASRIMFYLSFKTIRLIIISSLLAWPPSYLLMKGWLNEFNFRIQLNPAVFILPSLTILGLSIITICCHVWMASVRNPADCLRQE